MRIYIITDLDEFGPDYATIDIIWDDPPQHILDRFILPSDTSEVLHGLLLEPQVFVEMGPTVDPFFG